MIFRFAFLSILFHVALFRGEINQLTKALSDGIGTSLGLPNIGDVIKNTEDSKKELSTNLYSLSTRAERLAAVEVLEKRLAVSRQKTTREKDMVWSGKNNLAKIQISNPSSDEEQGKVAQEAYRLHGENQRKLDERLEVSRAIQTSLDLHIKLINSSLDLLPNEKNLRSIKSIDVDDYIFLKNDLDCIDSQIKAIQVKQERLAQQYSSINEQVNTKKARLTKLSGEKFGGETGFAELVDQKHGYSLESIGKDLVKVRLYLKVMLIETEFRIARLRRKKNILDNGRLGDERIILDLKKRMIEEVLYRTKNNINIPKNALQKVSDEVRFAKEALDECKARQTLQLEELKKKRSIDTSALETSETRLRSLSDVSMANKDKLLQISGILASIGHQREHLLQVEQSIESLELREAELELALDNASFKLNWVQFIATSNHPEVDLVDLGKAITQSKTHVDNQVKEMEAWQQAYQGDSNIETTIRNSSDLKKIAIEIQKRKVEIDLYGSQVDHAQKDIELAIVNLDSAIHSSLAEDQHKKLASIALGYKQISQKYQFLIAEVSEKRGEQFTWQRSPNAVSKQMIVDALANAERLTIKFFWMTQEQISPTLVLEKFKHIRWFDLLILLVLALAMFLLGLFFKFALISIRKGENSQKFKNLMPPSTEQNIMLAQLFEVAVRHFWVLFTWAFALSVILIQRSLSLELPFSTYAHTVFFLLSIPFLIVVCNWLLSDSIGRQWADSFLREKTKEKSRVLLSALLYSGAIMLPLIFAFNSMETSPYTRAIATVLIGAYTLIVEIVILLFLDREDFASILPTNYGWARWLNKKISDYYSPALIFLMSILIMYNPYVGYFNLAWKMTFLVPISTIVIYFLISLHRYIRDNLQPIFIQEEDEAMVERFENARLFYGFVLLTSFLVLFLLVIFTLIRIWGIHYTPQEFWNLLLDGWTIPIDDEHKFGVIQAFEIIVMLFFGVLFSNILNRFFVNKLIESLNGEAGLQNTVNTITQYFVMAISVVSSLYLAGLARFVPQVIVGSSIAIGYSLRDQLSDFAGGVFILLERQFEVGHFIQIEGEESFLGTVHQISYRSTVIRTARNFFVAIPNRIIISKAVTNWGRGKVAIGAEIHIRVGLEEDPKKIVAAIGRAIDKCTQTFKVPASVIRLDDITDSAMIFFARVFFSGKKVREMWNVSSEVRIAIVNEFNISGIKMPYPQRVIRFAQKQSAKGGEESIQDRVEKSAPEMVFDKNDQNEGFIKIKIPDINTSNNVE